MCVCVCGGGGGGVCVGGGQQNVNGDRPHWTAEEDCATHSHTLYAALKERYWLELLGHKLRVVAPFPRSCWPGLGLRHPGTATS